MLAPRDRRLLLDALRPPSGYRLDRAVGTSYSLDLLALLTTPLAFTFFDWEDEDGRPTTDPLALLEAIRRHADRIHLFCDAGRIAVPRPGQLLLHYLEGCVVESTAPQGGAFHPKLWVLRYVADNEPVRYRLLCLSRNLTFDRSWDSALVLDGELTTRTKAFAANHALGDFLAALPGCALRRLSMETHEAITAMAEEIRRVSFELPSGVDEVAFHPIGLDRPHQLPFPEGRRPLLVVSPFLSPDVLDQMSEGRKTCILVSRPEALEKLSPEVLDRFSEVLVPRSGTEAEAAASDEVTGDVPIQVAGLHAKLFVVDDGWDARIWTGSANATTSAFTRNLEFLVELRGKKSDLGIGAILGEAEGREASLRDLLARYVRPDVPVPPSLQEQLELRLDQIRCALARAGLAATVTPHDSDATFSMALIADGEVPELPGEVTVRCWPISLRTDRGVPLRHGGRDLAVFTALSFEALTGFFAFEITIREQGTEQSVRFTLNVPLRGAPTDRRERLIHSLLKDRDRVLRLLYLLLVGDEIVMSSFVAVAKRTTSNGASVAGLGGFPLLEALLKALVSDPRRLDDISRLLDDLRRTAEGRALLPDGLEAVWAPIWQARQELAT